MSSVADISLEDAMTTFPKSIVRVNYKGRVIQYSSVLTLGEGSFGKVYKGWNSDGSGMAVKIIDNSIMHQDYKARENLEREISIMKMLKSCDNVVQIFMAGQMKTGIIIAMEMCDGDLDRLLLQKDCLPEKDVIDFLYQIGEGMKELRKQNIVHRDIKPQNILIKYREKRIIFKLADFGYARHFDASRTKMMKTIVGSPLYLAPEALLVYLSREFPEKYRTRHEVHYNDKVDIWSIGAVLYKVMVGKDAFPAPTVQLLYRYLNDKQDNIAFKLNRQDQPLYLEELPEATQKKLTTAFRSSVTDLLVGMLKYDEKERFSFPIFFDKIDDIIESKVELINLLHGTSFKIIQDPGLTPTALLSRISSTWNIPENDIVIFSTMYPEYIGPHKKITEEHFKCLVDKSGGWEGHAKLYILSLEHIRTKDKISPDYSCLEALQSALDQNTIENLIVNLRFRDEIIYMIQCLKEQLHNQYQSVNKLYQFVINETGMSSSYNELKKSVQQALAQMSLMIEIVKNDLEWCGVKAENSSLPELLRELVEKEGELKELELEFEVKTVSRPEDPFNWKDCQKKISVVIAMTTSVETRKGGIPFNSKKILEYCRDILIANKTRQTRLKLCAYSDILESTWVLYSKEKKVQNIKDLLSQIQSVRRQVYEDSSSMSSDMSTTPPGSLRDFTSTLDKLREKNDGLVKKLSLEMTSSFENKKKYEEAVASLKSSEVLIKEKEIADEDSKQPSTATIDNLCNQLAEFFKIGERVARSNAKEKPQEADGQSPARTSSGRQEVDDLLLQAKDMATKIRNSISFMRKDGVQSAESHAESLVKIANPEEYRAGDIVLMTPVNTIQSGALPSILHLKWKAPYMIINFKCLQTMGIRPGRVPQLLFAKLRETPQKLSFKDHPMLAQDLGESDGIFYRATVDPVSTHFFNQPLGLLRETDQQQSLRSRR